MQLPKGIDDYLRAFASELGERILRSYPPLHAVEDPASPLLGQLLRSPFPAQTLAIMGVVKRWNKACAAATGSLGSSADWPGSPSSYRPSLMLLWRVKSKQYNCALDCSESQISKCLAGKESSRPNLRMRDGARQDCLERS